MRPTLVRPLLLGILGVCLLLGVTTCNARRDGRRQERIAQLEAVGYQAAKASLGRRHTVDSLARVTLEIEHKVISQAASNRKLSQRLSETLAANDSLLSDSLTLQDSSLSYNLRLRAALQRTTEQARLYRDSTEVLLGSVERMLASQSEERKAWLAERAAHLAELAAKDSLIAVLRESEQGCRILFVACPSRVQSVGIGAGIILLLLL